MFNLWHPFYAYFYEKNGGFCQLQNSKYFRRDIGKWKKKRIKKVKTKIKNKQGENQWKENL